MDRAEAEKLKQGGIAYRFAGMSPKMAKAATQLYDLFSKFNVHGGTMSALTSVAISPTEHSCAFHNRSISEIASSIRLFRPILEVTAVELMDLVGHHGTLSKRINEAGACVLVWLDRTDPRWLERLQVIRKEFGLGTPA